MKKEKDLLITLFNDVDAEKILYNCKDIWIDKRSNNYENINYLRSHYIKNSDFPVSLVYRTKTGKLEFASPSDSGTNTNLNTFLTEMGLTTYTKYSKPGKHDITKLITNSVTVKELIENLQMLPIIPSKAKLHTRIKSVKSGYTHRDVIEISYTIAQD